MDFTRNEDCVSYFERRILCHLQFEFSDLGIIHLLGTNFALISFRGNKMYRGIKYTGILIMIQTIYNQGFRGPNNFPIISGKLLTGDVQNKEWFLWESKDDMVRRIKDLRDK